MIKKPLILGIESSCDETAASVITQNKQNIPIILSNIISSQIDIHKEFGGVVPELAARSHIEKIDLIVEKAIKDSGIQIENLDAIASTAGPGLIVCLSVGLSFGKALAISLNKPFIAVNHLEGHALSPKLNCKLDYPYLLLLISGGHSQYLSVEGLGKYKRLGTTIDDALGEAFDKTAKILGIEFPGGPQVEILASKGNPRKFELPKPIFKTIEEILYKKTQIAFKEFEKVNKIKADKFVVAGGVAANSNIRKMLINLCKENAITPIFPKQELCGDNAAMIAMVGLEKFKKGEFSELSHPAIPRWPLDENAIFLKGAGVKL